MLELGSFCGLLGDFASCRYHVPSLASAHWLVYVELGFWPHPIREGRTASSVNHLQLPHRDQEVVVCRNLQASGC